MKSKWAYTLIFLGIFGLFAQIYFRLQKDRKILEQQFQKQNKTLESGLKLEWQFFLLQKIKDFKIEKKYTLIWNRNGTG